MSGKKTPLECMMHLWIVSIFKSENKGAIKQILRQNVKLCIKLDMIEGNTLFVDGSKFRANASINNTWDGERCRKRLEIAEKNIERIMEEAEEIDKEEDGAGTLVKLNKELQDQKEMRAKVQEIVKTLKETGKEKINTTDKDSVNGKTRQGSHAIMNCEVTTDEKYGLIVNSEAVSQNNDLNQLSPQVEQSTEILLYDSASDSDEIKAKFKDEWGIELKSSFNPSGKKDITENLPRGIDKITPYGIPVCKAGGEIRA